ncbi:MAG: O-antigen ligase/cytochrome c-type biogenesis protein CcmH/NrfG [Planctomycetota bacterium]|jgi:O-antigen ligase/cytochrome c-type biogenesis protein CcmH/NrfG
MTTERSDRSRWLANLWLLPTGLLLFPQLLFADPQPHATATGWALLFSLPALAVLLFSHRRGLPKSALCFLPMIAIGAFAYFGQTATDRFELTRTLLLLLLSMAAFLSGANLSERAAQTFQRGTILLSLAFTSEALLARFGLDDMGAAGTLGNSGVLSAVALPGAVLGALAVMTGPIFFRLVGALAALSFVLFAASTPVLTGVLAFAVALLVFAFSARSLEPRTRGTAIVFAALAPLLLLLVPLFSSNPTTAEVSSNIGGAEVRLRIWQQLPELVSDHALLGVGPGQFRASFPRYRDAEEIELSTFNHALEAGSEVEHAHSDVFQSLAEYGLFGGLAFALLMTLIAVSAFKRLRQSGPDEMPNRALGAAALALLINATLHAPLTFEPAPALLAWVLFGALRNSEASVGTRGQLGRGLVFCLILALVAFAPQAMMLTRHGELLSMRQLAAAHHQSELAKSANPESAGANFWLEEGRLLRKVIEAAPDSALAHTLLAQHFVAWERTPSTVERAIEAWSRVLELRPHQVSALIGLGVLTEDTDERRKLWEHALEIDPGHPVALSNLARLEFLEGDSELAFAYLQSLEQLGHTDNALIRDLGSRALLAGRTRAGCSLLSRLGLEFDFDRPEDLFALSQQEEQLNANSLFADALACGAHRLWALDNLANNDLAFARSKFRQALKISRRYLPGGDVPTRLLLAATLELTDRQDEARSELEQLALLSVPLAVWDEYPEQVRSALSRLGLLPTLAAAE